MATLIINIEDNSKLKFIKEFLKQFDVEFTTENKKQRLTSEFKKALEEYKNGETKSYTIEEILSL